jgi:hypothetical protein
MHQNVFGKISPTQLDFPFGKMHQNVFGKMHQMSNSF